MVYSTSNLPVSKATFDEIKRKLEVAGYPTYPDRVPMQGVALVLDPHEAIAEKAEAVDPRAALRVALADIPAELMAGVMYDRLCVFMPDSPKRDVLWCAMNAAFDLKGNPG